MLKSNPDEWDEQKIDDFLSLRFSDDETRSLLSSLTPERITLELFQAFLHGMQLKALAVPSVDVKTLDCCGTGGSGIPRFNTSTTAAFVMAAGGVSVVKFGNRAASSKSGSFDLLELLGIPATWPLEALPDLLESCGLVFLYAPQVYSELSGFMAVRRALGIPTIFNSMGPLLSPMRPAYRLLGVSNPSMQSLLADFLSNDFDTEHAWILRASSGLDELVSDESNSIYDVRAQSKTTIELSPSVLATMSDNNRPTLIHTPEENHLIFKELISGEDCVSSHYENVCLNAGAGIYVSGIAASLEAGIQQAKQLIADGSVQNTYNKVRKAYENLSR
jgi:anthranilate phosphoribosyltransferase